MAPILINDAPPATCNATTAYISIAEALEMWRFGKKGQQRTPC
jgi:hypothetical protein